jgi:hypothetical protein
MKTRNGGSPIQLPEIVKAGDDITAKWANQIRSALQRLRDRTPIVKTGKRLTNIKRAFWPSFRRTEADPELFEASLTVGYVVDRQVMEDPSLKYRKPTGIVDEFDEPIWQSISGGQCIYIKYECDKKGVIEGEPEMMIGEDDIAHEHWKPEGFQFGGANGEYYYKIAKFVIEDDQPLFQYFHAGENIDHYSERVNFKNKEPDVAGELRPIGHIYEEGEDIYWLKTAVQLDGDGRPIIMPLPDGETKDSIESIQFRRIKELETQAQIQVIAEDGDPSILIRGNEFNESIADARKITISVTDGLVTSMSKGDSDGWWGTVGFSFLSSESYVTAALVFEDGMLKTVEVNATNIEGTEGTPGVANINFSV